MVFLSMVFWLVASQLHFFFCGLFLIFAHLSVSTLLVYMSLRDIKGIIPLPKEFHINIFLLPLSPLLLLLPLPEINALRPDVLWLAAHFRQGFPQILPSLWGLPWPDRNTEHFLLHLAACSHFPQFIHVSPLSLITIRLHTTLARIIHVSPNQLWLCLPPPATKMT